jgi:hypothetical protein
MRCEVEGTAAFVVLLPFCLFVTSPRATRFMRDLGSSSDSLLPFLGTCSVVWRREGRSLLEGLDLMKALKFMLANMVAGSVQHNLSSCSL